MGSIWIMKPEKIRNRLGIVFQNNVLDDVLTVKENLMIRTQLRGLHSKELKIRMEAFRQAFRLSDIWNRPFGKLSAARNENVKLYRRFCISRKF